MCADFSKTIIFNLKIEFGIMGRQQVNAARMYEVAAESAAILTPVDGSLGDVTCKFLGVVQEDYSIDAFAAVNGYSIVAFELHMEGCGGQSATVHMRANSAIARGIAFPRHWELATAAWGMKQEAGDAARRAVSKYDLEECNCRLLGVPKLLDQPSASSDECCRGMIVLLPLGEILVEYVLCAHVANTHWICTRGNFINNVFKADDPFNEACLVCKDIEEKQPGLQQRVRRRTPAHLHRGQLKKVILREPAKWNLAVAISTWCAL